MLAFVYLVTWSCLSCGFWRVGAQGRNVFAATPGAGVGNIDVVDLPPANVLRNLSQLVTTGAHETTKERHKATAITTTDSKVTKQAVSLTSTKDTTVNDKSMVYSSSSESVASYDSKYSSDGLNQVTSPLADNAIVSTRLPEVISATSGTWAPEKDGSTVPIQGQADQTGGVTTQISGNPDQPRDVSPPETTTPSGTPPQGHDNSSDATEGVPGSASTGDGAALPGVQQANNTQDPPYTTENNHNNARSTTLEILDSTTPSENHVNNSTAAQLAEQNITGTPSQPEQGLISGQVNSTNTQVNNTSRLGSETTLTLALSTYSVASAYVASTKPLNTTRWQEANNSRAGTTQPSWNSSQLSPSQVVPSGPQVGTNDSASPSVSSTSTSSLEGMVDEDNISTINPSLYSTSKEHDTSHFPIHSSVEHWSTTQDVPASAHSSQGSGVHTQDNITTFISPTSQSSPANNLLTTDLPSTSGQDRTTSFHVTTSGITQSTTGMTNASLTSQIDSVTQHSISKEVLTEMISKHSSTLSNTGQPYSGSSQPYGESSAVTKLTKISTEPSHKNEVIRPETTQPILETTQQDSVATEPGARTGLSRSAKIGIGLGCLVLFWLILGPIVCLVCKMRDKAAANQEATAEEGEKEQDPAQTALMEQYIMTELARGRDKKYQTSITDVNEVQKLKVHCDDDEYEQSVDAEVTSF